MRTRNGVPVWCEPPVVGVGFGGLRMWIESKRDGATKGVVDGFLPGA